jgi:hypothetical protein
MSMTIEQIQRRYTDLEITGSETGRWIVIFCPHIAAERFDKHYDAGEALRRRCGQLCCWKHQIVEITEQPAMQPRRNFAVGY